MNTGALEQDWDVDPYVDDSVIDWSGFPSGQELKFPDRRFGLYEEAGTGDSHLGFAVDSIALEDDPE